MRNILVILLMVFTLNACATKSGMNQYSYVDVGQSVLVDFGTVLAVRQVGITGQNSGGGGAAGGALGFTAGANMGGGNGQAVAAVGGAIIGAIVGNAAEQAAANSVGMEYTVIKENGDTITVVQNMNKGDSIIAVGTRVIVQTSGSYQRVLPATNLPTKVKKPKGITFEDE